jgi:LPS-assembly protein
MPAPLARRRPSPPASRATGWVTGTRAAILIGVLQLGIAALLSSAPAAWAQTRGPVIISDGGQESTIVADQIQQVGGPTDLLVATGNVEITQGATRLLADRVELNRDTGEVVAQGKVVFFDGQDRLVGERVDYNLKTGTGIVYNGSTSTAPYYHLTGERMERVGDGIYQVRRGTFTTCEGDDPIWSFKFGSSDVDLNEALYGTGASFWVRNIPIIPFFPFFGAAIRRERQTGFLFPEVGNSSTKGLFLKVPFFWAISDSQDLTVGLDTYTKRGVGVEGEYRYIMSERARGSASGFLIPEFLRPAQDRERLGIPLWRGLGSAKHDWQITPRLNLKVDANATTDDLVYREYGDRLGDRARQYAETNVFLSQRGDSYSLTAGVVWYQDLTQPVANELQQVPAIKFFGVRQPIPGLRGFLYETESSLINYYRVVGSGGLRMDLHSRAYYPIPVAGLFTVTPFAGGRLTYYNQKAVGTFFTNSGVTIEETIYDPHVRRQIEGGFETETRASRVFDMNGWGGLSAVQHLIEPRATYLMIRGFDQKANPQYDPAIDDIGRVTQVIYSLTNRVNAKTTAPTDVEAVRWEAVRLALWSTFDIDKAIARGEPFKDMQGEFIFDPNAVLRFRADAAYNFYGLGFRSANLDLTARYRDVSFTLGSRYNAIVSANWVVGEVSARILANLDGHVNTNWDVAEGTLVEGRVGVEWRFQCFSVMADYVHRRNSENEFRFAIGLLGIGQFGTRLRP